MNSKPFTEYEWDIETHDANGDVVDHSFADKLSDFNSKDLAAAMCDGRLFLMRTLYDTDDSLLERWYAPWCVSAPMETGDAHFKFQDRLVPARFVAELRRVAEWQLAGAREVQ